mgnify:FL=1|jgi:hypothetical protein
MTHEQSLIFRKVLDTNWEVKELKESGKWQEALEKVKEHNSHVEELKSAMGAGAYDNFINMGQRMFAPKSN